MSFLKTTLLALAGIGSSVLIVPSAAQAGQYDTYKNRYQSETPQVRTYTRVYTKPAPVEKTKPMGHYCLYQPGDAYDLSYGDGCDYDGGHYGQSSETVIINNGGGYYPFFSTGGTSIRINSGGVRRHH